MKRNLTDLFDERNKKYGDVKNLNYGISVKHSKDNNSVVINASALVYLGAKIEGYISEILIEELKKSFKLNKAKKILVVGLGNKDIYNDALGPLTIEKLIVSRGLDIKPEVSVIAPNVFSNTGIETVDLIYAVCKIIKPDYVVLIDSLATISVSRLCSCFQISKGGLVAGSGANSNNKRITKTLLGVKNLISIGVPMLIYADKYFKENVTNTEVDMNFPSLIISPVDVKSNVRLLSSIISKSLNKAIFKNLSDEEIKILTD